MKGHHTPHLPPELGATWIPPLLQSVANIVQNIIMPDLTFNLKLAGDSGFWEPYAEKRDLTDINKYLEFEDKRRLE